LTISLLAEHGNQVLAALRKEADSRGFYGRLTAAELELMSLTGTGNGLDMVMMSGKLRERVPTSNFFRRAGYQRNPVARRAKVVSGAD
jgi:hypothetical protein